MMGKGKCLKLCVRSSIGKGCFMIKIDKYFFQDGQ